MKKSALVLAGLALAMSVTVSAQEKPQPDPVVWGATSGNTSCVIFAEGHKTSGRFYGVAVTTKTVGKLTLIETQNYTFDQKEVLETQENMDNLMRRAQQDRVKFVKIPEKYSPELLEKARTTCKGAAQ
jgi:hypothetical protein